MDEPTSTVSSADNWKDKSEPSQNPSELEDLLPPVDGGRRAWAYLIAACVIEAIVWGFPFVYGVFLEEYLRDPVYLAQPNAHTLLPLVGPLSSGLMYVIAPLVTWMCRRTPQYVPTFLWIGLSLCVFSLVIASYTVSISELVGLGGALYGIGGALIYNSMLTFLSEWFVAKRGLANGIIFAATGIGGLTFPLIIPIFIERWGTAVALRILAVTCAVLMGPCLPFIRGRSPPEMKRNQPKRDSQVTSDAVKPWFQRPAVWLLLAANTLQGFGHYIPFVWLPKFAVDLGLSTRGAALTVSLLNAASILGPLAIGYLSDRTNPWVLGFTNLTGTAFSVLVVWGAFSLNMPILLLYSIFYGIFAVGWSALWSGFLRPLANGDLQTTNTLLGLLLFTRGVGNILSAPVSTSLQNLSGPDIAKSFGGTAYAIVDAKYGAMILFTGLCFALAALFILGAWATDTNTRTTKRNSTRTLRLHWATASVC
ncbi:MFS general substrate transporter [Flagelloscypha sp. PMI_526]|nr:MFS general substrate transporter [Flagelloscypha sp. PMI_526]